MTHYQEITCPDCGSTKIGKAGFNASQTQRYCCNNPDCPKKSFMLVYLYNAYKPGIKKQIVRMATRGSGIRDTAKVLEINKNTVISTLKKKASTVVHVNPNIRTLMANLLGVRLKRVCEEAELDEQWSFVGKKSNQRWLWYAVDHKTNVVLAFVFGRRKDEVFKQLKALLAPFGIRRYYTDDWGAYDRHLDPARHEVGKRNTQKIERKNLNFRTWIKRLTRKTICFSKLEEMHDTVIGLLINEVEFGLDIY